MITVALPVWKSKDIAWLCMESLCRQIKPESEWELIIFEETHDEQCGELFFISYIDRLKRVGCELVHYYDANGKIPLSHKWVMIANQASEQSEAFVLCAADNYYSPHMLCDAEQDIKEADWCIFVQGYFYDTTLDKVLRYNFPSRVGLQMFAKTEMVRRFPMDIVNKGVDMWFSRQIGYNIKINNSDHWQEILCTNGMNNISTERIDFFKDPQPPYYETSKSLATIIPLDIYSRLKALSHAKNNNSNNGL